MIIGGLQKMTLIDFPGKIAATVFFCGCNFRCGFCQNPELVDPKKIKKHPKISAQEFFKFLASRQGLLDGICLTGGEPTIYPDLPIFIKKIKDLNFLVKLDTNGSNPQMLKKLFQEKLLDFVAMDIKASQDKYSEAAGKKINLADIQKSIDLIRKSKINYEFRTTVVPGLINRTEIRKIGEWLEGSRVYALQQFRSEKTLDKSWQKIKPYSEKKLKQFQKIAEPYFERVEIRGLK